MRKIINMLLVSMEFVLIAAAFSLNHFTKKKMGVMRYIVNKNTRWENAYPIEPIKHVFLAVLAFFIILTIANLTKDIGKKLCLLAVVVFSLIGLFILLSSTASYRAYYFIVLLLMFAAAIQFINLLIYRSK